MRTILRLLALALGVFIVFTAGLRLGANPAGLPESLQKLSGTNGQTAFNEAQRMVRENYYRPIPDSQIQNHAIAGVVASLHDRFSAYLDPKSYALFQHSENPHFSGIGLSVSFSPKGLLVTKVFPDTPAERAKIQPGETIVSVDGKPLAGKKVGASVSLVTGPPGSPVTVGVIAKSGKPRTLKLKRARISAPSVESEMVTAPNGTKVGVVALSGFVQGAGAQVSTATRKLIKDGAKAIVLDLRANGGGLLDEGVAVASVFIPKGTVVVTRGRHRAQKTYGASGGAISTDIPVAVLVDRNTASASEIVAGSIQDRHRGTIVGTRTFGKGVFQEITPLSNNGALDITVGEYFLPSGRNLGGGGVKTGAGVTPNVKVPASASPTAALNAAVAAVSGQSK
ncbi:MAG: S41 family peptidase [Solirubrobacterales bacterium]|nr:S41 family peptidase [Solirubrobacterales bacterium]